MMLDWRDVPGETPEPDCELLQELVQALPRDALIVDLGTLQGRTALAMASVCQGQQLVVTVDRFQAEEHFKQGGWIQPDRVAVERYAEALALSGHIEIVDGDTVAVGQSWDRGEIDLLYIDASHDYDSVLRDLQVWAFRARVVALHDYADYAPGVIQAAREYFGRLPDRLHHLVAVYGAP